MQFATFVEMSIKAFEEIKMYYAVLCVCLCCRVFFKMCPTLLESIVSVAERNYDSSVFDYRIAG